MPYPIRFVACTYNLWNVERWPDRAEALRQFLELHGPDILTVQELRPVTCDFVDSILTGHQRVDDPFRGWRWENNIWWSTELFDLVEYGAEDIGILEEWRRLFWVRLRLKGASQKRTLFVSTVHYTWTGHEVEIRDEVNVRIPQARNTIKALDNLVPPGEPLLFMGDLNDWVHPIRILRDGGLTDSFAALGRDTAPTWPAVPIDRGTPELDDWIFHRGPIHPMNTGIIDFYVGDLPPSDHKPLMATYRLL